MYLLKKFLTALILPPTSILLLLVIVWVWWPRLWAKRMLAAGIVGLYLLNVSPVENLLAYGLQGPYRMLDPRKLSGEVDAIVLLGGNVYAADKQRAIRTLGGESALRAEEGRRLFMELGRNLPIIASGGPNHPIHPTEVVSVAIRDWLIDWGVPPALVLTEERSRDTFESAVEVREILRRQGWQRVLLVTSAWHMRRSILSFKAVGLDPIPAPTDFLGGEQINPLSFFPSADTGGSIRMLIREYLGLVNYWIRT